MSTKEQIIETATRLFRRDGIKAVRMDDIASEMGISKRTLYEHFSDKEALLADCVEFYHVQQSRWMEKKMEGCANMAEELLVFLDCWEEIAEENGNFIGNLRKFYPAVYRNVTEMHQCEGVEKLKRKLQEGIVQGIFLPDLKTDIAVFLLIDIMNSVLSKESTFTAQKYTHHEAFKYIFVYFFRGISTAKGMRIIDRRIKSL